jgi:hypothetical protein
MPTLIGTEHQLHACDRIDCETCGGALAVCVVCGGAEISLTTECAGRALTQSEEALVTDGALDYKDGRWISTQSEVDPA